MIDAHQHFWRLARGDYGWLTRELSAIYRDFEPADLAPLLARHGIERTILVQAAASEAETDYLLDLARRAPFVAGVVGWVDFDAADAPQRIRARAAEPRLKGLRPMIQDLEDDAWMLRPGLAPAFETMLDTGLRFDALVKPRHLAPLLALAERYPGLPLVIDHGGKPEIARWRPGDAAFEAWDGALAALARRGAFAKLSGLVTEAGADCSAAALAPYVASLRRHFGPDRLLWGSDWPVVLLRGSYGDWRRMSEDMTAEWSPKERASLFGGAAARFYGL